ncbi:Nitrogen permease regulator 2 [Thecaphora frezii]
MQRVYGIIEQLYEDLNSYCESFVALPEAPYTSYINAASPQALNKLSSPMMGPNDFISLGASAASLRDEHQRKVLAQHLRHMQGSPSRSFEADPRVAAQTPVLARSRAPSDTDSPRSVLSPLTSIHPEHLRRTSSVGEADTAVASSPRSPEAILSMLPPRSRRPTVSRSATLSAIAGFGNGSSSGNGAAPSPTSSMAKSSSEARFTAFGRVSAEEQSELAKELMASEGAGAGSVAPGDPAIADQVNGALSARRSSGGSTGNSASGGDNGQMIDSVVSLRTIDAALSNSISALRHGTSGTTLKSGIAERREPPHGLGRTVRDAVNLKLFPTYPNPPPFNDWDVPVALLDLGSRVDGNWDLTMARIFPFIDGVNHVKRISQLADAELGLTRSCIEHLLYYGCIIMIDIFQYFNMYTVRPAIARMADDVAMGRECAAYVTRPGYPLPSYPELLRLYSLLRPGKNLHEWIEDNDVDAKGVDVRRFVSFGVIQGFLRRVHRYPVYLAPEAAGTEDGESRLEASGLSSTVRDSPMFKSVESPSRMMRDPSGSREPRDRRPRELTGSAIGSSGSGRVLKDGHVGSGVGGQQERSRTPQRRTASDFVTNAGSTHASETSRTTERLGVSPTKKHSSRLRQRAAYHHPTATVIDVASVAFDIRDSTKQTPAPAPRSPRKRVSSQNVGLGLGGISGLGSANAGVGASGISHSQRSVVVIPPELPAMLDGSHCDDELCVRFGIGWPDLEKMLIHLGTGRGSGTRLHGTDDSDDEGVTASGYRGTDWRRSVAGGGGASSGWSRAAKMSGISSGIYHQARSGGAGGGSGGESGSNAASRIYSERALGHNDSSILAHSGQAGGSASGWGAGSEDAGGPGWSGFGGLEKQAIEAGDLGRVKVLLQ